ncbi:hypothetical protein HZH68_005273 [Vespula germanica]|uniref:Uncharacterized protein n=1 Tax=Vespula germanica TaxID=30212 RepID=A0A834NFA1_VESGE|nr:hypothetical protein HZH68_005273 [Vespula germanica]
MQKVRISERSTLGHPVTSSSLEHLKKKEDRSSQEVERGEAGEKAREELEEVNTSKKKLQKNVAEKHQGQVPKALTKI